MTGFQFTDLIHFWLFYVRLFLLFRLNWPVHSMLSISLRLQLLPQLPQIGINRLSYVYSSWITWRWLFNRWVSAQCWAIYHLCYINGVERMHTNTSQHRTNRWTLFGGTCSSKWLFWWKLINSSPYICWYNFFLQSKKVLPCFCCYNHMILK